MLERIRQHWLDYAIRAVAVLIVVVLGYLAYSIWASKQQVVAGTPAARAINNLAEMARRDPSNAVVRVKLAQALGEAGRISEAVEQFKAAIKIDPKLAPAYSGLGLVAMQDKQYRAAEGYWRKVIDLREKGEFAGQDNELEAAYHYMGLCLMEEKKYEEAVDMLRRAIQIRRTASDTHYALSVAYARLDMPDRARQELAYVLQFDPRMPEANYDLGLILLKEGKTADAAEMFRTSADAAPTIDKPRIELEKLGKAEDHLKKAQALAASKPAQALDEARIAAALSPKDVASLRLVAQLYEKTGKPDKALDAYTKLLDVVPEDKPAQDAAKRLSEKLGKNG